MAVAPDLSFTKRMTWFCMTDSPKLLGGLAGATPCDGGYGIMLSKELRRPRTLTAIDSRVTFRLTDGCSVDRHLWSLRPWATEIQTVIAAGSQSSFPCTAVEQPQSSHGPPRQRTDQSWRPSEMAF